MSDGWQLPRMDPCRKQVYMSTELEDELCTGEEGTIRFLLRKSSHENKRSLKMRPKLEKGKALNLQEMI